MEAISVTDNSDLILTPEAAASFKEHVMNGLQHWQGLRLICEEAGLLRWRLRPKHHYMQHLAADTMRTQLNPRPMSCFQDESLLGHLKAIATKCHSSQVILRLFQRLILNLAQRFKQSSVAQIAGGASKKRRLHATLPV